MKKISFNILAFAVLLTVVETGCKKNSDIVTLSIQTEKYNTQEKTHIENANGVSYTCWDSGDQIKVNGTTTSVSGSSVSVPQAENYYAVYPASCVNSANVGSSTSITLPAVYEYTESGGYQVLKAPMAAKAVNGGSGQILFFKNLCTLLKIHVTNNITIYNINIHSKTASLSGTATVTIGDEGNITMGSVSGNKYVSLYFPEGKYTGSSGTGKDFYVPVPVLASGEELYVSLVASTGVYKNVYYRGVPVTANLPANLVIPLNMFPTVGPYISGTGKAYLMGKRGEVYEGSYRRPYVNTRVKANQGTTIEMELSPKNEGLALESYTPFLYGQNGNENNPVMFYLWRATAPNTDIAQTGTKRVAPARGFLSAESDKLNHRYKITHSPTSFLIENLTSGTSWDSVYTGTPATYTSSQPIYLMWAYNDNQNRKFMGKCYYFRISDASGIRFNAIPVIVDVSKFDSFTSKGLTHGITAGAGSVPCFYDMVSGEYFSSETTNTHFSYPQ